MQENPRPTQESRTSTFEFKEYAPEQQDEVRFNFAVARAESDDVAKSMLEERPGIDFDSIDRQREPIYNRVFSKQSIDERKKYWEQRNIVYIEAFDEWKNTFKRILRVQDDKTRISAIKSILTDENKSLQESEDLKSTTDDDVMSLFREYSDNNSSDVDKFMKRALDGATELETLKERLPHLKWVATAFFGKNTAEKIEKQLLLEGELRRKTDDEARKIFEGKDEEKELEPGPLGEEKFNSQDLSETENEDKTANEKTESESSEDQQEQPSGYPHSLKNVDSHEENNTNNYEAPKEQQSPENFSSTTKESESETQLMLPKTLNQVDYQITDGDAAERGFNLVRTLNNDLDHEKLYTNKEQVYIASSPQILLNHILSILEKNSAPKIEGMSIDPTGTIKFDHMRASIMGTTADIYNITISNDPDSPGKITAAFESAKKSGLTSFAAGDINKRVASELSDINEKAKSILKDQITEENKMWEPNRLFLLEGNMVVGFKRSKENSQEAT